MAKIDAIAYTVTFGVFLVAEVWRALGGQPKGKFLNKYLCFFLLSGLFVSIAGILELQTHTAPLSLSAPLLWLLIWLLQVVGTFLLVAYVLSRGMLVLLSVFGVGYQHPYCESLRRITSRKVLVYGLIVGALLCASLAHIWAIWMHWRVVE